MTDFHTHILPGIDDGCKSVKESLALLQEEARQGVTEVILTPHFYSNEHNIPQFLEKRQKSWEVLQEQRELQLPLLRLGAEVQYFEGICATEGLEALQIQGSELLLLEMPFCKWSERMIADVLELNRRDGFVILLAHIERYLPYQSKNTFPRLLDAGVLCQTNVRHFTRWQTRLQAMSLLNKGYIHVFGTDCHNQEYRPVNWAQLPAKVRAQANRMNLQFADRYLSENPNPSRNLRQDPALQP